MVENIYMVICQKQSSLLPQCFLQNGGNYKSKIINDMFNYIDIVNINDVLLEYDPIKTYLQEQALPSRELNNNIDDLVERRNEIAHGADSTALLSYDLFRNMLCCIEKYAYSMNALLCDKVLEKRWTLGNDLLINIDHVYNKNIVTLCIKDITKTFSVGDKLLVRNKGIPHFVEVKIEEIRVDVRNGQKDTLVENIDGIDDLDAVSIKISNEIKINNKHKIKVLCN